jgi:SAM-dependent methyltransferase
MRTETHLESSFGRAATEHYAWQTEHPYVGPRERELVQAAFLPLGARVLDVGCGEGATLRHLGEPEGATGIDLFEDKIAFARVALPRCRFVVGSVYDLPFENGAFDHIVVRDLVHHLDEPDRFVAECARVLVPGGRIDVLEPSRGNPLVVAHALALPVERGELRSTMRFLSRLLEPRFRVVSRSRHQPMPIHRILFHPDFGRPRLADHGGVTAVVAACERLATRLPRALWAYLHVRAVSNA